MIKNLLEMLNSKKIVTIIGLILASTIYYFFSLILSNPTIILPGSEINTYDIEGIKNLVLVNNNFWIGIPFQYSGEVVAGHFGDYYLIDIITIKKNGTKETIHFKEGKYTISKFNKKFLTSLYQFEKQVLTKIKGQHNYKIFIRGSADIKGDETFKGYFEPGFKYDELYIHKKGAIIDTYEKEILPYNIIEPFKNKDLPNLRARFIQEILPINCKKFGNPEILGGVVEPKEGPDYRHVMLLLFIQYRKSKLKK